MHFMLPFSLKLIKVINKIKMFNYGSKFRRVGKKHCKVLKQTFHFNFFKKISFLN